MRIFVAAMLLAAPALAQSQAQGGTPSSVDKHENAAEKAPDTAATRHTGQAGSAADHGKAQVGASGSTTPADAAKLAEPSQEKPAEQPQAPIADPTPQEASRGGTSAEKPDATKTEHQSPQTSSGAQSGSSQKQ